MHLSRDEVTQGGKKRQFEHKTPYTSLFATDYHSDEKIPAEAGNNDPL